MVSVDILKVFFGAGVQVVSLEIMHYFLKSVLLVSECRWFTLSCWLINPVGFCAGDDTFIRVNRSHAVFNDGKIKGLNVPLVDSAYESFVLHVNAVSFPAHLGYKIRFSDNVILSLDN